jgi:hypothetical protein
VRCSFVDLLDPSAICACCAADARWGSRLGHANSARRPDRCEDTRTFRNRQVQVSRSIAGRERPGPASEATEQACHMGVTLHLRVLSVRISRVLADGLSESGPALRRSSTARVR